MAELEIGPIDELPPGEMKLVEAGTLGVGVFNCGGELYAIEDIRFEGRGCAISQAATSMLTEMVQGRSATEIAALPKEELLEEIGIPLTPVRLKCAILGLGVLKVALHRAKGTPLPEEWSTLADEFEFSGSD